MDREKWLLPAGFIFFLLFVTLIPGISQNGEPATVISAGIAKRNITPDIRVKNWVTGESYGSVRDSIYVRAIVLGDGHQTVAILSWDLVNASESATAEVRRRIATVSGLIEENILVNASHNHSAPWSPEYERGLRGIEADPWWVVRYMPPQYDDAYYQDWMEKLMQASVEAVMAALEQMQPVSLWISRTDISAWVQNRRPRKAAWGIEESHSPDDYNYRHEDWDPRVLVSGDKFGPVDRTMTVLSFRNGKEENVATMVQMTAHAVSIYPYYDGISADWPGEMTRKLKEISGGEILFLQGTAGDINPWRRGDAAVEEMANALASQAAKSGQYASRLQNGPIISRTAKVGIPLTNHGQSTTGLKALPVEIQVLNIGSLAIVTLPGEPMTAIGMSIREASPFPQTLVLGYSNGSGVYYVGMPGEKVHGGYETGENTNIGTDIAGELMARTAISLLKEIYDENYPDK